MDMQNGVHGRFLDHSTSVREAAIELVGKFILIRPELTAQYYDMLSERILVGNRLTAVLILLYHHCLSFEVFLFVISDYRVESLLFPRTLELAFESVSSKYFGTFALNRRTFQRFQRCVLR